MTDFVSNTEKPQPKRRKYTQNSHTPSQPDQSQATIYSPLDKAKREIRICHLSPAPELSNPLQCSLQIVPIDEAGKFAALPYVWGTDPATETISVDGIVYAIKPNLAAGLRQLRAQYPQRSHHRTRHQSRPIFIWVDALCIDQGNDEERNHQVNLMRLIFTRCEYVFAWLGDADEDSDLAMDSIPKIKSLSRKSSFPYFLKYLTQENPFYEAAPWNAIYRLLQREFWYRVWIFQELLLPKNLIVCCGSKSLPWSIFELLGAVRGYDDALERDGFLIRDSITHINSEAPDKIVAASRIIQSALLNILLGRAKKDPWRQGRSMAHILNFTLHLQATDPRDKIYGLLALTINHSIKPDYSKTTQQVYTEVSKLILADYPDILAYSGISTREDPKNPSATYSWVPDWDWISRSIAETATKWRDLELYGYFQNRCFDFRKFEIKQLPGVEVLRFRGQICQSVVNPSFYTEWLDPQSLAATMRNMYDQSYPRISRNGRLQAPIPMLVALYRTFTQHGERRERKFGKLLELVAGFCYSTSLRIESGDNTGTSTTKISPATLLHLFEDEFESGFNSDSKFEFKLEFGEQSEQFSHIEKYSNGYLAQEKASLHHRVFFETPAGHFGLGPPGVKEGDIICKIYGCEWPFILRKVDSHYCIVGACWVLGFVGDEGFDESQSEMIEVW